MLRQGTVLLGGISAAGLIVGMTMPMQAVAAAVPQAQCSVFSYADPHGVTSFHHGATITQASSLSIGPGVAQTVTKTASLVTTITASTTKSGGASASASWLWGKVSVHFDAKVAHTGQHTVAHSGKVTQKVSNNTKHNETFIAFNGTTKYFGGYFTKECVGADSSGIGHIKKRTGRWTTYGGVPGNGIVLCGGGASTAIVKAALKFCNK
jgi:hypothetical protein